MSEYRLPDVIKVDGLWRKAKFFVTIVVDDEMIKDGYESVLVLDKEIKAGDKPPSKQRLRFRSWSTCEIGNAYHEKPINRLDLEEMRLNRKYMVLL
ncbi:hypothetical protein PMIN06_002963 [Paraphaeosphaeria minitans]|uniref:Uncharacterized protein n=1 Tax=Paraphaeosphaeria minitans TaxID=565426 RepID=A0A9P6GI57_9PLEO|nr:hypothetical protein PMIN01_06001 [Paraphaeosphaeria minitans]